ncbi:MAG: hypothetical protein ACRD2J_05930 [Thermoanaerobaculia bacterium]
MTAAELLIDTAARGQLHHAIILHGPSPDLLRDLALRIAQALNCLNVNPGDGCAACARIERGSHPDVHRVEVAENRKLIAAEQIREMVADATLRPYEGRTKVFIVDGADAISPAAANAMLKTLEEPSRDTVFLLLTRSADLLLPTIRSRSQAIAIRPVHEATARAEAAAAGVPLQLVRLRRETEGVGDPAANEAMAASVVEALARFAASRDLAALLAVGADLGAADDPNAALAVLAIVLRDLAALEQEETIDPDAAAAIQEHVDRAALLRAADIAVRNATRLTVNADARLLVEQALLTLAQ